MSDIDDMLPDGMIPSELRTEVTRLRDENARLRVELAQVRAEAQAMLEQCAHTLEELHIDTAKVVNTLDCALQTVDALIAWMPEGLSLSPTVSGCKERLDIAMRAMTGGIRK